MTKKGAEQISDRFYTLKVRTEGRREGGREGGREGPVTDSV